MLRKLTSWRLVQGEMKCWTGEQSQSFLRHAQGDRLFAAWALALCTGMRKGEILGLRWKDSTWKTQGSLLARP